MQIKRSINVSTLTSLTIFYSYANLMLLFSSANLCLFVCMTNKFHYLNALCRYSLIFLGIGALINFGCIQIYWAAFTQYFASWMFLAYWQHTLSIWENTRKCFLMLTLYIRAFIVCSKSQQSLRTKWKSIIMTFQCIFEHVFLS